MAKFLSFQNKHIAVDSEGYLKNLADWDTEVAHCLAKSIDIQMSDAHWEVISIVRSFYHAHQLSPPMRPLVKLVQNELGKDKGRSIYLMKLFGGSTAKSVSKIAGLPRPANCL
jgi:tRNA 2-thiouridine synthesizing protein E